MSIREFLEDLKMVGQIYPTLKSDLTEPVIALLIPMGLALEEYNSSVEKPLTKNEFISTLKKEGVDVFSTLEDFIKYRNNLKNLTKAIKENKVKHTRNISEERKIALKEHASSIRAKIGGSTSQNH